MSGKLDSLKPTVNKLINQFGKNIFIKQIIEGLYDVDTGTVNSTQIIVSTIGVVSSPKTNEIDNTLIEKTDLIVTVSDVVVSLEDIVTIDGKDYTIKSILPLYSGNLIAYYKLVVKGVANF